MAVKITPNVTLPLGPNPNRLFMIIQDRVFGKIEIKDPLIIEIIKTSAFQRLKRIGQLGGVNLIFPNYQTTRFEHSVGVWHVLKSLGASLEVQIAGLLHDIGHTAFSHMVDHALSSQTEDFHEKNIEKIPGIKRIYKILKREKIVLSSVDDYPEVKRKLPDIGADRVDYAIRDYVDATFKKKSLGKKVLKSLKLKNRNIIFTDLNIAKDYALTGLEAMWLGIYDPKLSVVYASITEMLKKGLETGWLKIDDLFTDDKTVFRIFKKNRKRFDPKFLRVFDTPYKVIKGTKNHYDYFHIKLKTRYFDPLVEVKGRVSHLTELDKEFSKKLDRKVKIFEKRKTGEFYRVIFPKKSPS